MRRTAFSLVELSIVLVILGLLVGGILAGQSLIRASELRSVMQEATRFQTAGQAFRDKYFALPGDMANATSFWGKLASYCNGDAGTASSTGTCNGNGDGMIVTSGALNSSMENYQFWSQLALAGMIEGVYTGISGSAVYVVPGVNAPVARVGNRANWAMGYYSYLPSGDTWNFVYNLGNRLRLHDNVNGGGVMAPPDAWYIDGKADDGMPGTGKVLGVLRNLCTNSTSATDYAATYRLDLTDNWRCSVDWKNLL